MSEYSRLAAKRYRQYLMQQQKESLIHRLAVLVLGLLEGVVLRMLNYSGIAKRQRVQKVKVE